MTGQGYTIGRAARAAGVGVETVRFYERKGLIEQPPKPTHGARRYPQATVERIRSLRQGQELGFSLAEIDRLLALAMDAAADCGDVRKRAESHLEDIERKRARLGDMADKLRALIAACPGHGARRACAILDAVTAPGLGVTEHDRGAGEGERRVELDVTGMACGGCAGTVRAVLHDMPGVRDAAVDRVAGTTRARIDPAATDVQALSEALTNKGFPASPRRPHRRGGATRA